MSDSVSTRDAITKTREAVLAQQMHEVDKLTDKIVGVAVRIEQATAELKAAQHTAIPNPAPQTAKQAPAKPAPAKQPLPQRTTWPKRWAKVGAAVALIAVGAAVGAGTARLMPMAYGGQALDLALASSVKHQLMQEGGNGTLWRTLGPQAQNAAIAAMGH